MKVRDGNREYEFTERMTARRLLEKLGVLPEIVVVVKNEEIVTEDEMLDLSDEVEVVRVVSGGEAEKPDAGCKKRRRCSSNQILALSTSRFTHYE